VSQAEDQGESDYKISSFSGGGACVEVELTTQSGGAVRVRHSRHHDQGTLIFSACEWRAFVDGVKAGEFDPS